MSDAFDPYYIWLGIPPEDQPPNYYRLLGIELFEANREVIEAAANRQMAYMQEVSAGEEHIDEAQKILGELSRARVCLLNSEKKAAYDAELRESFDALTAAPEPPATTPVADDPLMPPTFGLPDDELGVDEAGESVGPPAVGLPPPHTATAKKQSILVPVIGLAVVALALIGGIFFYFIGEAKKQEQQRLAQVAEEKAAEEEAQRQAKIEAQRKAAAADKAAAAAADKAAADKAAADKAAADKAAADKAAERKQQRETLLAQLLKQFGLRPNAKHALVTNELLAYQKQRDENYTTIQKAKELKALRAKVIGQLDELSKQTDINDVLANYNKLSSEKTLKIIAKSEVTALPEWAENLLKNERIAEAKAALEKAGLVELNKGEWADQKSHETYTLLCKELEPKIKINTFWKKKDGGIATLLELHKALKELNAAHTVEHKERLKLVDGKIGNYPLPPDLETIARDKLADKKLIESDDHLWELDTKKPTSKSNGTPAAPTDLQNTPVNALISQMSEEQKKIFFNQFNILTKSEPKELQDLHALAKKQNGQLENGGIEPKSNTLERHNFLLYHHPDIPPIAYGGLNGYQKTPATAEKYYIKTTEIIIAKLRKMPAFRAAGKRGGSGRRSATDKRATHYKKLRKDQLVQTALDVVDGKLPPETEKNK